MRAGDSFTNRLQRIQPQTSLMRTFYMLRKPILAVLTCLALATVSQATVTISTTSVDTPGLAGFKTWTVTAVSTDPITAIDFVGDGSNDAATGRGFFGPLNQVGLPTGPTIFEDGNILIPIVG